MTSLWMDDWVVLNMILVDNIYVDITIFIMLYHYELYSHPSVLCCWNGIPQISRFGSFVEEVALQSSCRSL